MRLVIILICTCMTAISILQLHIADSAIEIALEQA
jgi:hypothetical protein